MSRIRRILHPTDFSSASRQAFAKALELAASNRAELVLLHIVAPPPASVTHTYLPPRVYAELEIAGRAQARKQLDTLIAKARKAGVRARALVGNGIPAERIVRAARSQRADLVVLGTHGRSGLVRFFLGSVAGRVVATAPCPVLTVRGR